MSDTGTTKTPDPVDPNPTDAKSKESVFTQADVDAIAGRTRKEAKDAERKALLKELGFEDGDLDTIKARLTVAKEAEDAKKSAEEKAAEEILKLKKERDEAKQAAESAAASRIADRVNTKLELLASKAKVEHPEDVVKFLRDNHADDIAKLTDDNGAMEEKAAEKLIDVVRKARPNWFAVGGQGSPSNKGGKPPQPDISKQFGDKSLVRW